MKKIYSALNLPENTKVDKKIEKEKFIKNSDLDEDYKAIFERYVENIVIKYCLKSSVLGIKEKLVEDLEYSEIEILEVEINNNLAIYDVATMIGKTIQYPVILIFRKNNKFKIGIYIIRENKKNYDKNVVEDIIFTGWFREEKLYGRINNIIKELDFINISKENMYKMFQSYYDVIKKYHCSYILLSEILDIFNFIEGIPRSQKLILDNCENVSIDENSMNKIDWMKNDKMQKYTRKGKKESIMICKDELLQYVYDYGEKSFKNYEDFENAINYVKRMKILNKKLNERHSKYDCIYFDGKVCIYQENFLTYKKCTNAELCEFFKKSYKRSNQDFINIKYTNTEITHIEQLNNIIINIVEYGDTIEVLDIDRNIIKKFVVYRLSNNVIPEIPYMCLDKEVGFEFSVKNIRYKLINIIKNTTVKEKNNETTEECNIISKNKEDLKVRLGDWVEILNIANEKVEKHLMQKDKNGFMPLYTCMCLNKKINYKFKIRNKKYKIIKICKN